MSPMRSASRNTWRAISASPGSPMPGCRSSPYRALARKYLPRGAGAVFTFGVRGGFAAGIRLVESVRLFSHLANIGDTRSLILHPASTTHRQLTDEQREAAGAGPDVIRLSIGLESAEDLIRDLDQALSLALVSRQLAMIARVSAYPDVPNTDLLDRIPLDARVVLDVGCGAGALGAAYRRLNPRARLLGIEQDRDGGAHRGAASRRCRQCRRGAGAAAVWASRPHRLHRLWRRARAPEGPVALLARHAEALSDNGTMLICVPNRRALELCRPAAEGRLGLRADRPVRSDASALVQPGQHAAPSGGAGSRSVRRASARLRGRARQRLRRRDDAGAAGAWYRSAGLRRSRRAAAICLARSQSRRGRG